MIEITKIDDCFDKEGNFIVKGFDPYRTDREANDDKAILYNYLFDKEGYANIEPRYYIYELIKKHEDWHFTCDAVKYYFAAECIDSNCKGIYTAVYAWRH